MMMELGAKLDDPSDIQPLFRHPCDSSLKVYVLFDVCHMLKLLRNTLVEGGIHVDADNNKIRWDYLVSLHQLQQDEGLHLANKLTKAHVKFHTQKMSQFSCTNHKCQYSNCHTVLYNTAQVETVSEI
jgi:hypothetical protein